MRFSSTYIGNKQDSRISSSRFVSNNNSGNSSYRSVSRISESGGKRSSEGKGSLRVEKNDNTNRSVSNDNEVTFFLGKWDTAVKGFKSMYDTLSPKDKMEAANRFEILFKLIMDQAIEFKSEGKVKEFISALTRYSVSLKTEQQLTEKSINKEESMNHRFSNLLKASELVEESINKVSRTQLNSFKEADSALSQLEAIKSLYEKLINEAGILSLYCKDNNKEAPYELNAVLLSNKGIKELFEKTEANVTRELNYFIKKEENA